MSGRAGVLVYYLCVAIISIGLFASTLAYLAAHEIGSSGAAVVLIGTAVSATVAVLAFQQEKEPWPNGIFAAPEKAPLEAFRAPLSE